MKSKYRIEECGSFVSAGCDCCVDYEYYFDIVSDSGELISGGFLSKEDSLLYLLRLHDIEVEVD